MSTFEIVAAVIGVACVALTVRQHVWSWPIGIVNAAMYLYVFFDAKLYADVVLQAVFVVQGFVGWWRWLHPAGSAAPATGHGASELPITRLTAREAWAWAGVWAVGTAIWGTFFATATDAAFPYLDSATTVASLVANWLLTRKVLENWAIWVAADVVMIGLYAAKGLYPTAVLYVVYLALAAQGGRSWYAEWAGRARVPATSATTRRSSI